MNEIRPDNFDVNGSSNQNDPNQLSNAGNIENTENIAVNSADIVSISKDSDIFDSNNSFSSNFESSEANKDYRIDEDNKTDITNKTNEANISEANISNEEINVSQVGGSVGTSTENSSNKGSKEKYSSEQSHFYTENYRKPKHKKGNSLSQLILVSIISSIIGGSVVFAAFLFLAPAIQPSISRLFNNTVMTGNLGDTNSDANDSGTTKKIIIESENSPIIAVAEKVGPSIVGIRVTAQVKDWIFGTREGLGEGSGIIIREDGYILTNNHVVADAVAMNSSSQLSQGSKIEVILPDNTEKIYQAKIIGRDPKTDLAVLKIDAKGLQAVEIGDSEALKVGELAVAIGNPAGLDFMGSVTSGIISGLNRKIITEDGQEFTLIQTDAAINQGNSGGALVNAEGKVIGINTIKIGATGFEGLGFAIPINSAKEIADNLIEYKYVKGRPFLGVSIDPAYNESMAQQYNLPVGLVIADVIPASGAYKAGLQRGDIITKVQGKPVKTFNELEEIKNKHKPGETITLEVYRDGKTLKFDVLLTENKGN